MHDLPVFDLPADARGALVGLSGGVDSAVAALLLVRAGIRVEGVTLSLWSDPACKRPNLCCSAESILAARATADALGIEHHLVDMERPFLEEVVDPFVEEYARARTPNPCARCNSRLRFPWLRALAEERGLSHIATGHYARLLGQPAGLARAADRSKDQSYVLAQVPPGLLARTLLPLGGLTKAAVRALARDAGLPVHSRAESQEACFIPDNDYRRFLRTRTPARPGAILSLKGTEIGRHESFFDFTIGQRKGLRISSPEPLYVVSIEAEDASITVGPAAALDVDGLLVSDVVRHREETGWPDVEVQFRSTGGAAPARAEVLGDRVRVSFLESVRGVSPGQVAVGYCRDMVLWSGIIESTFGAR